MLVYLAKYEKAPGKHMPIPRHIPHEFTEHLKKGVGVNSIKSMANEALRHPEWIDCLLDILTGHISWDRDGMRKAAWMLHHVYLLDERALLHHRSTLTTVLDHTEDPSVLREVLKVLGSPLWSDTETDTQRVELLQLGMDLMYDTSLPSGNPLHSHSTDLLPHCTQDGMHVCHRSHDAAELHRGTGKPSAATVR